MSNHEYEALVIGAGGAGLYAALEASRGAKTAVLSKLGYLAGAIFPIDLALKVEPPRPRLWTFSFLPILHTYNIPSLMARSDASWASVSFTKAFLTLFLLIRVFTDSVSTP